MSGAYRDTGAAIERAEALEREVDELRAEVTRLKTTSSFNDRRPNREPERLPPDVEELHNEVVNLRAENELLRAGQAREVTAGETTANEVFAERDELRREVARLQKQIINLRARLHDQSETMIDNRDAVIRRLTEEREELTRELRDARDRYEAEPPASRNPKTFEDTVLAILNRLVK